MKAVVTNFSRRRFTHCEVLRWLLMLILTAAMSSCNSNEECDSEAIGGFSHYCRGRACLKNPTSPEFRGLIAVLNPNPIPATLANIEYVEVAKTPRLQDSQRMIIRFVGSLSPGNENGCLPLPTGSGVSQAILMGRGGCTFAKKINHAAQAGSTLAIIQNNDTDDVDIPVAAFADQVISALTISKADGDALRTWCDSNATDVYISVQPIWCAGYVGTYDCCQPDNPCSYPSGYPPDDQCICDGRCNFEPGICRTE